MPILCQCFVLYKRQACSVRCIFNGRPRLDKGISYTLSDRARIVKSFIIDSMKFNEKKVSFTQQKMNEFSDVFWSEISCFLVRNLVKLEENGHF